MIKKFYWFATAFFVLLTGELPAQDAQSVLRSAIQVMGATNLDSIEFSGSGWYGQVGQSATLSEDWPRLEITEYKRLVDYEAGTSREDLTRRRGDYPVRGGGAPFSGDQIITELVNGQYAWNLRGSTVLAQPRGVLDGVSAADFRQLDIILTPHGFLKAALESNTSQIISIPIAGESNGGLTENGREVQMISFLALGKYKVNGAINDQNFVEVVSTWVPTPVYGDMLLEMRYTQYENFDGIMFPTIVHEHQGDPVLNPAHNSMEIRVTTVRGNIEVSNMSVPGEIRSAQSRTVQVESQELSDGVWRLSGGSHHSVLVEFDDFVTVIEAPMNEARSLAVIAEVGRLVPEKPIRYVVSTHHHFDHIGGLRTYVAQGVTVIAHEGSQEFFEDVLFHPGLRSLNPDRLSTFYPMFAPSRRPVPIETVKRKYVISDGIRILDLYSVRGLTHADTMLIPYLPDEGMVINADMYNPSTPGTVFPESRLPNMRVLASNIDRLGLDVQIHVGLHGQVSSHSEFLQAVSDR
jgi:glyoxylase-like metal-dependent hydrolase (beta-lactamase superfamily II)